MPAAAAGHVGQRADGGDPRGDLGVGGRHDLAAVAEVDLVAVVLRRVVAGGDHHAGDAPELADREGQQRGGQRPRQHQGPEPGAGHHLGGVAREDVAVVPGVEADDDGCRRRRRCRGGTPPARPRRGSPRPGSSGWGRRPSAPRSPAVPNSSVPAKRSARSAASPPASTSATTASSSARVGRVRVLGGPGAGAVDQGAAVLGGGAHGGTVSAGDRVRLPRPGARKPRHFSPGSPDLFPRSADAGRIEHMFDVDPTHAPSGPATGREGLLCASDVEAWAVDLSSRLEAASGLEDAQRVDTLRALERLGCVITAAQAHLSRELDESQRAAQAAAGVPAARQGAGVADQVATAPGGSRRTAAVSTSAWPRSSPASFRTRGRPGGRAASPSGRPRSSPARPPASRSPTGWSSTRSSPGTPRPSRRWGTASWPCACLEEVARLDAAALVARRRRAESERRVTLRPAPDTMTYLTALLPVKDGVAVARRTDPGRRRRTCGRRRAVARAGDGRHAGRRVYEAAPAAQPDRRE